MTDDSKLRRVVVRKTATVGGLRISYREERDPRPEQEPLLLIHGLGMSSAAFAELAPRLTEDFHILAIDLPGCGHSQTPPRAYGVPEMVDGIIAWLDQIGVDRVNLLGHSLGGQIVVRLAARYPERVRKAVVVSCPPDPAAPRAWQAALRLASDALMEPTQVIRQATFDYLRSTPRLMWQTWKKALRTGVEDAAHSVNAPTLVVRGTWDPVVTGPGARELSNLIPNSGLVEIERGTHGLPLQSPEKLAAAAVKFLKS
ncbi:alpha/beta fold hydrolase [Naumannella halotolerans]|nr:alpha/beta hydrolase [Naumannella halotolerans]